MRIVAFAVVGFICIAIAALFLHGLVEFADWIVEYTHEPYSHSIPHRGQACWPDGQAIAVVPPAVSQVVRL